MYLSSLARSADPGAFINIHTRPNKARHNETLRGINTRMRKVVQSVRQVPTQSTGNERSLKASRNVTGKRDVAKFYMSELKQRLGTEQMTKPGVRVLSLA